jgi:hypothetical protein
MSYRVVYQITDTPEFKGLLTNTSSSENTESNALKLLNKIDYISKNNITYKIIRYNKHQLTSDLISTYGLIRSVVLNSKNQVLCFSPPKSVPYESFITHYPEKKDAIVAEEFVEGTMINVFWDKDIGISGSWEIATRSTIGANTYFYNNGRHNKTFRDMFQEAATNNNLDLNTLNPNYCYSFVLQHKENRIVTPFVEPQLYLIEAYEIINTDDGKAFVSRIDSNELKTNGNWSTTTIKFPLIYENWTTFNDLKDEFASMNTPYDVLGVVIRDKISGVRCKIRNPVYEMVRHLRGNQPKLEYQYLCLRKEGKVGDYLKYYPEYKKDFAFFRSCLHNFTNGLYKNYISCYIHKEKPLKEFPDHFRTHMFKLHEIYTTTLKPNNEFINNTQVINYVNSLHPSLQMYSINSNMRKRQMDFTRAELLED